jgi:hypothetical protein
LAAIKRAFIDPEEKQLRSDTVNYLTATQQGGEHCDYPPEPEFENPEEE